MIALSEAEAAVINYLYKCGQKPRYPAEVSKGTNVPRRSVYTAFDELERKGIVEKEQIGRMKLYRLTEKWIEIAEAAKPSTAETDEARTSKSSSDKTAIVNNLERFLPLAERAFDAPSLDKLKDALSSMKKELKKEKRK